MIRGRRSQGEERKMRKKAKKKSLGIDKERWEVERKKREKLTWELTNRER